MTTITVSGVSFNITGLQPITNYRVSVQASNVPVVDYGPTLSGVFATLPEAVIPPGGEVPTLVVPRVGDGSSGIIEIIIPSPPFDRQDFLRYVHIRQCICLSTIYTCSGLCYRCTVSSGVSLRLLSVYVVNFVALINYNI